ncbi:DNA methyltransferase [Rhodococcus sp. KBS0724]|jgi:alkylated DNA nucleotide flippase Atl1|uniref:MGMT family protein n=1 Tax=Rhodococcus sp. KBS0724 TaxID=1179674 RepID=UPI00110E13A1|nr:MGMT family protein [Rhodococcus sp. KBS0724]TSD48123.1 DNA methyltransferase [Rhodococcus sp. KBS0724]
MAATTDEQIEEVRRLVASIPSGFVATYGDIADAVGLSSPRTVGWIMRTDSSDLPWHRVLGASGKPAAHLAHRQIAKLELEGVPIKDGRIDMSRARHTFP